MACSDEINDCELMKLTLEQLLKKALRLDSNGCLVIGTSTTFAGTASITTTPPLENTVTTDKIVSAEPIGSMTEVGLFTAYTAWKAGHTSAKVVRELFVTGGDGVPAIYISYIP